ncbi:RNA polymerase sigma-70 factor, ECF subfamily [Pustulibacterium marinum]|uniref:RNA polymerase sigma-70 factor, ECF subfamily n=1 Tax=Pustulibacterium marinum TaxID=1224947 RepID=A0A1I7HLE1_9FLAO|nr:RNA polymerase sigma factor [Pustulibacterium marinum]SFU61604.1 RNA polymerase sigma-70 factor, ECF subfamily [Pustulibacterium marinum]
MFQGNLIEKCKKNDRKAQLQLYNKYCDGMFHIAYRFMKSVEDAEDVMQEAFVKAFRKLHQYQGEVTFGAWLKRIVINQCIDRLKYEKQQLLSLDDHPMEVVQTESDYPSEEENLELKEQIMEAIASLSEKYRIVVLLYLVEGYDHAEISEILGITETASRTKLLRGKRKLQGYLKAYEHGIG